MTMSDNNIQMENTNVDERSSKPSSAQLNTIVCYIEQHPELGWKELRNDDTRFNKVKRQWKRLSKILNCMEGSYKTSNGWRKFWMDKRRNVVVKNRLIKQHKYRKPLSSIENRIMKLHLLKYRNIKRESDNNNRISNDDGIANNLEDKSYNLMDTMIEVMGKQAVALSQMAQESLKKSAAMAQISDASYRQALAVDNLATIVERFSGSMHEVRNAFMSIGYSLKRRYPPNFPNGENPNNILFS